MANALRIAAIVTLLVALASPVAAACPAAMPGTTAEAISANSARLLCLQQELAASATIRKHEFDLQAMQRSLQDLQLQRRFDALPPIYIAPPSVFLP